MSNYDHKAKAQTVGSVRAAIIIVSDSRSLVTDESGPLIRELLEAAGHVASSHDLVSNDSSEIARVVSMRLQEPIQALIISGGTGLSSRDLTVETVSPLLEKRLDGFGEFFRRFSEEQVGVSAMMSRATAGTVNGKLVVCLPGSKSAVSLALEKLLLPELRHIVWEINR